MMIVTCQLWANVDDLVTGTFYVGMKIEYEVARKVVEVQADGDELAHILCSMDGLPTTHKPVQRWFGDDAKFIVGNW